MFPVDELATQRSPYTDLRYELPIEYKLKTEYTSSNMTLADQMWESLDVDSVLIAVTPEWAENKGLPDSKPFLWDKTKRVYYIKVFHQLHCLKAIRKTLHDFISTNSTLVPLNHVEHCLDILRQDLMCKADDTPMIATHDGAGSNQTMQCKDLSKLRAWVQAPAQHSCYRHLDNYVNLSHPDERYAFCPEDSPYYPAMQEWFKKHGHHDPFQE
ncbi:hypothetical protein BGW36DRAFT_313409 [Talaromyces proteolyticus]|uniref:Uncharacterized protein n=1 Tax=Talaromyces proteolyticus TaxID=1131652 RepID=A0AAD4KYP0_9EURO|nr:uncharacterized protein BGW36DRAFT_313409 [Talaromyces proteolyticus]KAH8703976.1 hypothetical protein BGW36DRAFT_313409 [Talaromyces proteolyticus]